MRVSQRVSSDLKTTSNTNEPVPALDTSRMSAGQRAALEMTEAARKERTRNAGFAASLFRSENDLQHQRTGPRARHLPHVRRATCRAGDDGSRAQGAHTQCGFRSESLPI